MQLPRKAVFRAAYRGCVVGKNPRTPFIASHGMHKAAMLVR